MSFSEEEAYISFVDSAPPNVFLQVTGFLDFIYLVNCVTEASADTPLPCLKNCLDFFYAKPSDIVSRHCKYFQVYPLISIFCLCLV